MDVLWSAAQPLTATDIRATLNAATTKSLAATTVLTVLSRLGDKDLVTQDRTTWPHRYAPTKARAEHMAELMHEVLGRADNRAAVLARFVGQVSAEEADQLRHLLESR